MHFIDVLKIYLLIDILDSYLDTNDSLSVYVCVCMCVCVCTCMHVCVCAYADVYSHIWRPEFGIRCFAQSLSIYAYEAGSLIDPGSC